MSSSGAGPSWPRAKSTPSAGVTAAARLAGGAWPPGVGKQSATTESDIAKSSDEAGPSWPKARARDGVAATAAVKLFGEARPPGIAKHSAVSERELAEGSDGVGPSWSRASGDSAAAAADVKSVGNAQRHGIAKMSATTEPESAESSDEVGPSGSRENGMNNAAAMVTEAPETASQDRRLQQTVELSFVDCVEVEKLPFRSGFLGGCVTKSAEYICSVASCCRRIGVRCALVGVCSPRCGEPVGRRRGLLFVAGIEAENFSTS